MSNSVSSFTTDSYSSSFSGFSYFYLYAYDAAHVAYISFDNTNSATQLRIYKRDLSSQTYSYDLTKEQIAHLLSLDCPDAFIAYALTLCPCPPETSDTALNSADDVDGGILSIAKKLKEIKEQINSINGSAFEKSLLTDAQHYQLLDVEMFIDDFIAPYSYREVIK